MSGVGRKIVGGPPRGPPQVDGPPSVRSGPSSTSGQPQPPKPFPPGLGYDPAKGPNAKPSNITNTRLDLPQEAYRRLDFDEKFESQLPKRKSYNNGPGNEVSIRVNQYKVTGFYQRDIHQYDIKIGKAEGPQAKGLIMAVWMSRPVQQQLRAISQYWLWNGDKIAWCDKAIPREEIHINVDLDAERGRTRGPNAPPNTFLFIIKKTKVIRMATINAYLTKEIPFDNSILECINFLDHLLRHTPNENLTAIKRSYFARGVHRSPLDNCIEAMKGVYSSLRLCDISSGGRGVALNVDVANGTFWTSQDVHQAARNFCRKGNQQLHYETFRRQMLPIKASNGQYTQSEDFKSLRKMAKLKFTVKHQGKVQNEKKYTIKGFYFPKEINTSDPKYNYRQEGYHSKNVWFDWKTAPNVPPKAVTIYQYFQQKYNITLQHHGLPLVETEKAGKFPMEICTLLPNQQYKYKLDPDQTSAMIKFAVTRPKERLQAIQHGINMLKWSEDAYLKNYNLTIDPNMTITKARVLKNPKITFSGTSTLDPGTTGRWDLRGKKFYKSNPEPLKSWGIGIMENAVDEPTAQNFIKALIQSYVGHGGVIANKSPVISRQRISEDPGEFCKRFRQEVGDSARQQPQIMLFVLGRRDSFLYERLKKNMDCRFAHFSQMLNKTHVIKAQPQYCSNVCMKINAKLGGTTGRIGTGKQYLYPGGTMIVGADVSHPSPGSPQPSMAAITVSMDAEACRFAAAVQTNGHRVEMITEANFRGMFIPLVEQWMKRVGEGTKIPDQIFYFRDGVSEAQYQHVLDQEVAHMEKALTDKYGQLAKKIKWVVTICSKRHHIRFFPKDGDRLAADRNNNALPGTLVERDVTHPFENDFYLCAHSAIQGTARPVHYHVIRDDANIPTNGFHKMIYEMSYQYMRSTTPVSIIPAVYYAHLASNRARAHEDHAASAGPRGGQKFVEARNDAMFRGQPIPPSRDGSSQPETEAKPLLPMGDGSVPPHIVYNIRGGMWYI